MARPQRRAVVIGGSMSGLFAALYLRRLGWRVDAFERSPAALVGRGAGIMTHPEMHRALAELGLDSSRDFGVPVERRLVLDRAGQVICERRCPQIATSWNRLFDLLRAAFGGEHYRLGRELVGLSQAADGAVVHFADGGSETADLVIGADGFRSSVRGLVLPGARPCYAGYVGWRGLADEAALSGILAPEVFASLTFVLPPGEQFLGYPVAGPGNDLRPGKRSWNIVWYRPADESTEVPRLLTDETGHMHELSIPPPLIARAVVAEMRAAGTRLLPASMRAVLDRIEQPFLQPIYDLESEAMAFGRVALMGDAAFVVRPHVGAGIVKAIGDAAALAEALAESEDVAAALRAYEARRIGVGRRFVVQARLLGSYLRYSFDTEEQRRLAVHYADPARVLAETALLDFLRAPG
jgi:2-polyprenyl-6-methoxyphenol hydroxylase-like FAD-dependent oxidoreductase